MCIGGGSWLISRYAIRAFIGVFEASCYPGALMLLMSWVSLLKQHYASRAETVQYTPREIALRIGFYHSCQSGQSRLCGGSDKADTFGQLDSCCLAFCRLPSSRRCTTASATQAGGGCSSLTAW